MKTAVMLTVLMALCGCSSIGCDPAIDQVVTTRVLKRMGTDYPNAVSVEISQTSQAQIDKFAAELDTYEQEVEMSDLGRCYRASYAEWFWFFRRELTHAREARKALDHRIEFEKSGGADKLP